LFPLAIYPPLKYTKYLLKDSSGPIEIEMSLVVSIIVLKTKPNRKKEDILLLTLKIFLSSSLNSSFFRAAPVNPEIEKTCL
jgi:hypothetical protein